jgi:release factor glutamine methyltransferase
LQYLTGDQGFRRLVLEVRPGVFVPRPETEVLVDVVLRSIASVDAPVVVDLCTGSGTVALAVADEHPGATVFATDVSEEAVALARVNADRLGLPITVERGDLFEPLPVELQGTVDVVCANPPYVSRARRDELPPDVLADPDIAVFGEPELYQRIFADAYAWVRAGGSVAVEIEDDAASWVVAAASVTGFEDVVVQRDLAGRDRVVSGRRT